MSASGACEIHSFSPVRRYPAAAAIRLGLQRQRAHVGAGVGLGQGERRDRRAGRHLRDPLRPQLLAAGLEDRVRPEPLRPERRLGLGARARERLADEAQLDRAGTLKQARQQPDSRRVPAAVPG